MRYKVEATLGGQLIDPGNIQVGENVQFVVAGYTATNTRIVQSATAWGTTDTINSAGVLSASGAYAATSPGGPFTVFANVTAGQQTGAYQVKPVQALVTGTFNDGQGRLVEGLRVQFYDAGGNVVSTSTTQSNGFFRASVPTSAVTFDIDSTSYNHTTYYSEFKYNNLWYLPGNGPCRPNLGSLSVGVTKALGTLTIPATTASNGASLPPPPPPTGCG